MEPAGGCGGGGGGFGLLVFADDFGVGGLVGGEGFVNAVFGVDGVLAALFGPGVLPGAEFWHGGGFVSGGCRVGRA